MKIKKKQITAARVGKTKMVKVLQGNYGYGWDDLCQYEMNDTAEIKQDLKSYRENERGVSFRVIQRRVPNPAYTEQGQSSITDSVTAAIGKPNSEGDAEYYKALADGVVTAYNNYWDTDITELTYEISNTAITFFDNNTAIYIQPLESITPDWDDLNSDIDELYECLMGVTLPF